MESLVLKLSDNFKKIIHRNEIEKHDELKWGNNGIGDRWANKKFNYSVIYSNGDTSVYSEKEDDIIPEKLLNYFLKEYKSSGKAGKAIIGIYVHSKKEKKNTRPIKKSIKDIIKKKSCVSCGTTSDIVCDHKNDLYNDERVLNTKTQEINDFQPLCNHCNLQKRQVCKDEKKLHKIYSAKNIERYKQYDFEFPWEKKAWDINDKDCKKDTYWYDPVEFDRKIYLYSRYTISIINEIKLKVSRIE